MKLAEALITRSDLKKELMQLRDRIKDLSKVQEGDEESPEELEYLLHSFDLIFPELEELVIRINNTNNQTEVDGVSLSDLIVKRELMKLKIDYLRSIQKHATDRGERYSRNEIRNIRVLNVSEMDKTINNLSKKLRLLDLKIQNLNWTVDLI